MMMMIMMMTMFSEVKSQKSNGLQNLLSTYPTLTYRPSQNAFRNDIRSRKMMNNDEMSDM
jgi:hypothetical protein